MLPLPEHYTRQTLTLFRSFGLTTLLAIALTCLFAIRPPSRSRCAIFGLYGAVFAFLLRNRRTLNPAATRGTDLSAHLGGLIAGFLAGLLLAPPRPALESR
jgi:membrane associated rhomboid family serine protease